MNKWGKQYWADLGERVGSTLIFQVITLLTLTNTSISQVVVWTVVGLPTVLSLLKGLLSNMKTDGPTASLVNVTSETA